MGDKEATFLNTYIAGAKFTGTAGITPTIKAMTAEEVVV